jgi:hypothetical protein
LKFYEVKKTNPNSYTRFCNFNASIEREYKEAKRHYQKSLKENEACNFDIELTRSILSKLDSIIECKGEKRQHYIETYTAMLDEFIKNRKKINDNIALYDKPYYKFFNILWLKAKRMYKWGKNEVHEYVDKSNKAMVRENFKSKHDYRLALMRYINDNTRIGVEYISPVVGKPQCLKVSIDMTDYDGNLKTVEKKF